MRARLPCLVPFCGRTTAWDCDEWICSNHWRQVSRALRRRYARCRRKLRKRVTLAEVKRRDTLWGHCQSQAIGRGFCA